MSRLQIPKTYKQFIGGKFPRSESGRTYRVTSAEGEFVANAAQSSRKDARDAVTAARSAFAAWSGATSYNRVQVLYRIAEVLEGRRTQFIDEIRTLEGGSAASAAAQVDRAIDLWVWYAGWADKYAQVLGSANPVAGPYFNLSVPEPTGVVAQIAPQGSDSLLGLVAVIAPAIVSGNTVVVIADERAPLPAISFAEVVATSDVPDGVVNILTGSATELGPWLASHADVDALDLTGAGSLDWVALEEAAAETITRVVRPTGDLHGSLQKIAVFTETKTIWHTTSLI